MRKYRPRIKERNMQDGDENDLVTLGNIKITKETRRKLKIAAFKKRMSLADYVVWYLTMQMDKKFLRTWSIWRKALKGQSPHYII